jgi:uncharacterized membrane protein YesL
MGLMFEVAEGGFLDIDVRIVGPDGKTIHQVRHFFGLSFLSLYFIRFLPIMVGTVYYMLQLNGEFSKVFR